MFGFRKRTSLVAPTQHLTDILTGKKIESTTFTGNPYKGYLEQVDETAAKYEGCADWGNQPTRNIIDVRASFILGNGVKAVPADGFENSKELEFINAVLEENNIAVNCLQWAREAEIEGKFLLRIMDALAGNDQPVAKDSNPAPLYRLRYIPFTQHKYEIQTPTDDYAVFDKAVYRENGSGAPVTIEAADFCYAKFGGRTHMVNLCPTKVGSVLRFIESLDRALRDWREINHLFAAPTPVFECESSTAVEQVNEWLKQFSWKIGRLLIISGAKFKMESIAPSSIDSLKGEIERNAAIVSGAVGVPVHFLGFPELMSNRSTAENLLELVYASTSKDRALWTAMFTSLFNKLIERANRDKKKGWNPKAVKAEIPEISSAKLAELTDVWLPMFLADALSIDTLLSRVPDLNVEEEKKRLKEAKEERIANLPNVLQTDMDREDPPGKKSTEDDEDGKVIPFGRAKGASK